MFSNIGGKIKVLAQVQCWLGIIGSIIYGIVLISASTRMRYGGETVALGVAVMIGGSFLSWICSFFGYGFGELIERVQRIDNKLNGESVYIPKATSSRATDFTETDEPSRERIMLQMLEEGLITEDEYRKNIK